LARELVADLPQDWGTRIRLCRGTPLYVQADRVRVEQVIYNLLTNAIKYSRPETRIRIGAFQSAHFAQVFIADRGQGIPADQISRVFDRYFRVDSRRSSGLGLGLDIVKQIVQQHGGTVGVRSQEGRGSIFRFSLPIATATDVACSSSGHVPKAPSLDLQAYAGIPHVSHSA
jgi:signal transduction histidine kinase